jgi:protein-tyrosine-phosphatase
MCQHVCVILLFGCCVAFHSSNQSKTNLMNVLFLCTGNSCRSVLGEATFNHLAPAGWMAMSAGSKPTGQVHFRSLALLAQKGISTEGYHSKTWDNLPVTPDIVITVCSNAAGEVCPAYLGNVLRTHWEWTIQSMPPARKKRSILRS